MRIPVCAKEKRNGIPLLYDYYIRLFVSYDRAINAIEILA